MKINGLTESRNFESLDKTPGASRTDTPAQPGSSRDQVRISGLSSRLSSLEQQLVNGDEFDAGKVSRVQASMRDGSFRVDSHAVADKLLSGAKELMQR